MTSLEALLLGLLQGFTEFLPVSSSGHLVLGQALLGLRLPGVLFEVTVHVATLCAVVWVYRASLARIATGALRGDRGSLAYVGLLLLASVPAGVAGTLGGDALERTFERPVLAAAMLLVTGAWIWTLRWTAVRAADPRPGPGRALAVGVAQAISILPGISRSGSTVATGAALGVEVERMAEFSFLLSLPAIAGAALLQLVGAGGGLRAIGIVPLAVGFVAASLSGVLAIRIFIAMLRARTFHRFAYYCWAAGVAYLVAAAFQPGLR